MSAGKLSQRLRGKNAVRDGARAYPRRCTSSDNWVTEGAWKDPESRKNVTVCKGGG